MLHRDLKPDNVLLREDGSPVLTDFGIIKLMADDSHTRTGTVLGTAAYMAPEQIEGGEMTPQSDLYSLGVMLFELVTGHRPFIADSPIRLMMKQTSEAPPLLSSMIKDDARKEQALRLEPIIDRILAKSADERFQSASEFSHALQEVLTQLVDQPVLRVVQAVTVVIRQEDKILIETEQVFKDGRRRVRNQPPSEKMKLGKQVIIQIVFVS